MPLSEADEGLKVAATLRRSRPGLSARGAHGARAGLTYATDISRRVKAALIYLAENQAR
jgi:hypothetical protein